MVADRQAVSRRLPLNCLLEDLGAIGTRNSRFEAPKPTIPAGLRVYRHAAACTAPSHLECPTFRRLLQAAATEPIGARRKKTLTVLSLTPSSADLKGMPNGMPTMRMAALRGITQYGNEVQA